MVQCCQKRRTATVARAARLQPHQIPRISITCRASATSRRSAGSVGGSSCGLPEATSRATPFRNIAPNSSYVHRLDLATMTWDLLTAYIAGNIQAVSDTQLILKSIDQWVTFTNNAWGSGTALIPLNTPTNPSVWGPGYYAIVYEGDFRYDVRSGAFCTETAA